PSRTSEYVQLMRTRLLVVLALLGIAATSASGAVMSSSVTAKVRLPAIGKSQISLVTVRVTAPAGKHAAPVSVRSTNDARIPTSASVAALITPRTSTKRIAIFKVWVFVARGYGTSGVRATSGAVPADVDLDIFAQ